MAVAVVVEEGAAGVPAGLRLQQTGLLGDVGEGAIAVVAVEDVLAVVADKEIVPAIIVVIADAAALSPSCAGESSFRSDVGEVAVAIVFEEVRDGFLSFGKAFEAGAGLHVDIRASILIIGGRSYAATTHCL